MSEAQETTADLDDEGGLFTVEPNVIPFIELSRLMVVGIDNQKHDKLVWKAQATTNGPWEPEWRQVNEKAYSVMCAGATKGGYVAVVAQTKSSGEVHYIDEATDTHGNETQWNAPVNLGFPKGVSSFIQLAMGRDADGRVEIFGIDKATRDVWWIYQNPLRIVEKTIEVVPPGQTEPVTITVRETAPPEKPWSSWARIGGQKIGEIAVANDAEGRIMLIATGEDPSQRTVYRNQQSDWITLKPDQWGGWIQMTNAASGSATSMPYAILDTENRLNIFVTGTGSQVVQCRQDKPSSETWTQWVRPGMTEVRIEDVIAGIDGDGHINLVAIDANGGLYSTQQTSVAEQQWSGWEKIAEAPGVGQMDLDYNADGRLTLFLGQRETNGLSCISQFALNSTSWDAGWAPLASGGIFTFSVVRDLTPPKED